MYRHIIMDPACILPAEMWEAILERLVDPKHKLNLVRTNSWLECTFHSEMISWKFIAEILPILVEHAHVRWPICTTFNAAIRNCRLASSSSSSAVDNYIEYHWKKYCSPPSFTRPLFCCSRVREDAMLLTELGNHQQDDRSPILSKCCYADLLLHHDIEFEYGVALKNLMTNAGKHLRGLSLRVDVFENIPRSFHYLKDLLTLTPNIQRLQLGIDLLSAGFPHLEEDITLPSLPNLQHLDMNGSVYPRESRLYVHQINIMQYFLQITDLRLRFYIWADKYNVKGLFPKLKRFSIYSILLPDDEEKAFKFLDNLDAPQLEELSLKFPRRKFMGKDFEKLPYFVKTLALFSLKKHRPECEWNVSKIEWLDDEEYKYRASI